MGFIFNRQLNMVSSAMQQSIQQKKPVSRKGAIRSANFRSEARNNQQTQQLSAKDLQFLKSIGLKIRK